VRVAALLLILWVGGLWLRTGLIPASSAGDDVWFSESAYWLLHDGQLRRDIHADAIGSAVRDFLPPVPALGQAVSFRLFGINQFSIGLAASVVGSGIVCLMFALARGLSLPTSTALFASIGFAFTPIAAGMAMRVRYDVWAVVFWIAALDLILIERKEARLPAQLAYGFGGGMAFAIACFAYYALGPTLLCLFGAILVARVVSGSGLSLPMAFAGGAVFCTAAFLLWIRPDYQLFIEQNIASLHEYSWYQSCVASVRRCSANIHPEPDWLLCLAGLVATLVALVALTGIDIASKARFTSKRWLWIVIGCLSLASWAQALIMYPRFILFSTTFSVIFLVYRIHLSPGSRVSVIGTGILTAFAVIGTLFMLAADYRGLLSEKAARDYRPFEQTILKTANLNGLVLTDVVGWLAFRGVTKAGQLHLLLPFTGEPPDLNRSTVLFDASAANTVTSIVISPENLAAFRSELPLVDAALRRPDMIGPIVIGITPGPYYIYLYTVLTNDGRQISVGPRNDSARNN
jgi:hypothetical protein